MSTGQPTDTERLADPDANKPDSVTSDAPTAPPNPPQKSAGFAGSAASDDSAGNPKAGSVPLDQATTAGSEDVAGSQSKSRVRDRGSASWDHADAGFTELLDRVQWLIDTVVKVSPLVFDRVSAFVSESLIAESSTGPSGGGARAIEAGLADSSQWLKDLITQLVDREAAAAWLGVLRAEVPGLLDGVSGVGDTGAELVDLLDTIVARLLDGSNTAPSMVDAIVLPLFDRLSEAFVGTAMQDLNMGGGVPSTKAEHDID